MMGGGGSITDSCNIKTCDIEYSSVVGVIMDYSIICVLYCDITTTVLKD